MQSPNTGVGGKDHGNRYDPIIHIAWAGPTIKLKVGKNYHTFEMHRYCGPMRLYADGDTVNQNSWKENSPFWPVFNKWMQQGQRVDGHGIGLVN